MKKSKLPSLENTLAELTQIIDKMEHGDQELEQSLDHFERGIALIKHAQKILHTTEQKIQILVKNNDEENLAPYENKNE